MIPELGHFALLLALLLAAVQATLPLAGTWRGPARWMALARPTALLQAAFVGLAFAALLWSFAQADFTVAYVTRNANTQLPLAFRLAAAWGGHEGSLLLWALILAGWSGAVALCSRTLPADTVARVLGVMGWISVGFLAFLIFTSNPFERQLPGAPDGNDLNPLLQDAGMIFHPPLLYMGYVGFAVAFAFAVAALIEGRLDHTWIRWMRPWTLVAWAFLTLGILLGSFWAYYELGWGGWWFWDAVENASFMPWLVGTALLHSLAVAENRDAFKRWTLLLAILAFALSLLGTFLVRSGVLSSVHAFASDPQRGLAILALLAVLIGGALTLYAWRAPGLESGSRFGWRSREAALLLNNLLLCVAAGSILLGTLYPLALETLGAGRISVGPPYFESVFVPLMVPLLALLGLGPWLHWKHVRGAELWRRVRWVAAGSVVFAGAVALTWQTSAGTALGLLLAAWIGAATVAQHLGQWRPGQPGATQRWRTFTGAHWGMVTAHLGMAVFVAGATLVSGSGATEDVSLRVGDSATLRDHVFTLRRVEDARGPNYIAARAVFDVAEGEGAPTLQLQPERRFYTVQQMPMTEAAIDRGFTRDLYVSLGERLPDGRWVVRLQLKPFMGWVWSGALLIALGGFAAALDRRYRRLKLPQAFPLPLGEGQGEGPPTASPLPHRPLTPTLSPAGRGSSLP
jgi:cytochrome c-type biogenesis protein CcmF